MYSKYNILEKEIQLISENSWWEKTKIQWSLKEKYEFEIKMPRIHLFRMTIVVEDMEDEDCNFSASDLCEILLEDFIEHIRSKNSMEQLHQILESKKHYINDELAEIEETNKYGTVSVKIERKIVRRAEVFFADMEHSFPNHGYTVEKLINILTCDYMSHYVIDPGSKLKYLKKWYV